MLETIQHLIFDMDGVLWRGDTPMPELPRFFNTLDQLGISCVLATNNATKTAVMYTEKLAGFGVTMPPERIMTSAETTARYLHETYGSGRSIYVLGDVGLHQAIAHHGFPIRTPDDIRSGAGADIVVAGFTRNAVYEDFAMAVIAINNGATFYGTNPDVTYPSELGSLPGAGALQALITAATGIVPTTIGKPGPIIFEQALKAVGGTPANTAMVGDRLNTDIFGAHNVGMHTILVLSGISTGADVASAEIKPDLVVVDIHDLAARLTAVHARRATP